MYTLKLKDNSTFMATSVEETARPESDGKLHVALIIQHNDAANNGSIASFVERFTEDNIGDITVYGDDLVTPVNHYTEYKYVRYLTSRVLTDGKLFTDFSLTKENLTI